MNPSPPPAPHQGLDFAPARGLRLASGWAWLAVALAGLALAALAWQGHASWHQQAQADEMRADLARVQAQRERLRPAGPAPLAPAVQADALAAAQALAMPWGPLLAHLARRGMPEVALTQLEPDARAGSLLLAGQARSPEAALAYARGLGQGRLLRQVQLLSHEPLPQGNGLNTQFRITARWATETPGAAPAAAPQADAASAPELSLPAGALPVASPAPRP